ncbi:hypothetical protein HDU98_002059 [Podochytrium sp. JEL0797]|nr:hypothetical protein HDU98_002059 [Podochytrium sp. JEL0797]
MAAPKGRKATVKTTGGASGGGRTILLELTIHDAIRLEDKRGDAHTCVPVPFPDSERYNSLVAAGFAARTISGHTWLELFEKILELVREYLKSEACDKNTVCRPEVYFLFRDGVPKPGHTKFVFKAFTAVPKGQETAPMFLYSPTSVGCEKIKSEDISAYARRRSGGGFFMDIAVTEMIGIPVCVAGNPVDESDFPAAFGPNAASPPPKRARREVLGLSEDTINLFPEGVNDSDDDLGANELDDDYPEWTTLVRG